MITENELKGAGYTVLQKGGWIRLDPMIIPHEWEDTCKDFGVNPNCDEIILAVAGVKQINYGEEE
jgi:hypothetical protein